MWYPYNAVHNRAPVFLDTPLCMLSGYLLKVWIYVTDSQVSKCLHLILRPIQTNLRFNSVHLLFYSSAFLNRNLQPLFIILLVSFRNGIDLPCKPREVRYQLLPDCGSLFPWPHAINTGSQKCKQVFQEPKKASSPCNLQQGHTM